LFSNKSSESTYPATGLATDIRGGRFLTDNTYFAATAILQQLAQMAPKRLYPENGDGTIGPMTGVALI
jgi:hypothetical protein